jgi:hypothetical protein
MFDLVHSPLQEKKLGSVLNKLSSTIPPFSVQLCNPFRNRNSYKLTAVHYNLKSEVLYALDRKLRRELREFVVLERYRGVLRTTRFVDLTTRGAFRPKIAIQSKLSNDAADDLVLRLKAKYGAEPRGLKVHSLSTGPQRGRVRGFDATTAGLTNTMEAFSVYRHQIR